MGNLTTINDLLEESDLDLTRVGFARHPYRDKIVRHLFEGGYMDLSMSLQNEGKFDKYDYVLSFLGFPNEKGLFLCGYKVQGYDHDAKKFLKEYPLQEHISERSVYYHLKHLPFLEQYNNKLLIRWGEGAIAWLQKGTNIKQIIDSYDVPLDPVAYLAELKASSGRRNKL